MEGSGNVVEHGDVVERRVMRVERLVHVGELSSARQALEGSELAPRTRSTLDRKTDSADVPKSQSHARSRSTNYLPILTWTRKCSGGTSVPHQEESREDPRA